MPTGERPVERMEWPPPYADGIGCAGSEGGHVQSKCQARGPLRARKTATAASSVQTAKAG